MSYTYDVTQLSSSTTYQIRFYLGDTDSSSWQLQDEEIAWAYTVRGNTWGATALCALALQAKYSRLANMSADGVSQSLSLLATQFRDLAVEYQQKEAIHGSMPFVGGVSISDMLATIANTDRVPDIFRVGIFDNPPTDGADFFSEGVNGSVAPADEPIVGPF